MTAVYRTGNSGTLGGAGNPNVIITSVANDHVVALVTGVGSVVGVTGGTVADSSGGTYTLITGAVFSTKSWVGAYVRDTAAPASASLTITWTPDQTIGGGAIVAHAASGMSNFGISSIAQSKALASQTSGTTPAVTFDASANTADITYGAVGAFSNPPSATPPASWTERFDVGTSGPAGIETITRDSGFAGTTITWGGTILAAYGALIVELNTSSPVDDQAFPNLAQRIALAAASNWKTRPQSLFIDAPFFIPHPDKSLTQFPPDGYGLGLLRMSVGLGYLSDVEYYVASPTPSPSGMAVVEFEAFRPRNVGVTYRPDFRRTRFVDAAAIHIFAAVFDAYASSPGQGLGPTDPGRQLYTNSMPVTISTTVVNNQANGSIWVTVSDSYGFNVISAISTDGGGFAGWSESGWVLSAGVWTNNYTKAVISTTPDAITFTIGLGLNTGHVYVQTSAGPAAPQTDQAVGVGNQIDVHVFDH